ncbi:MAG: DUF1848 domain-containing protein [Desulfobacterota bacterium]|nr:DUF1848 domain-containing protein [Thermodesulfobacteriota bacterium]
MSAFSSCPALSQKSVTASSEKVVLSASRRTDLVSCYPEHLARQLENYPPETVHTIVIWTKNPEQALRPGPLRTALERYQQLYVHLTITGLGGSVLEPGIPPWQDVAAMLPQLIELTKSPHRISWRFDPLVRVQTEQGVITNSFMFSCIAKTIHDYGITTCRVSWVEPYPKVLRRMEKKGYLLVPWSEQEKKEQAVRLEQEAQQFGMRMFYCSVPGFPRSRCIDGELFSRLHPHGAQCSLKKAKGQRTLCGCTESIDIGWYSLKCKHGCLYCYAEPFIPEPIEKKPIESLADL